MASTTTRCTSSTSLSIYFIIICSYISYATAYRNSAIAPTKDYAFITISIDKLMISSPPERCCTKQKLPNCEVCTYTCKFFVYDSNNPERVFIDHKFDCSIETTGKKIQIPLLRQLSASKIDLRLDIFTKSNDLLVNGVAMLPVETLEHAPESRILRIIIEDQINVDFGVSITCVEGFVGPHCNITCVPPKKGEHHICSPAGKFCEAGWIGDDCSTPVCTYGCLRGKCVFPNKCICEDGWHGERCDQCKPMGGCKQPYYDNQTKKCKCPMRPRPGVNKEFEEDKDLKTLKDNNSTYLTLSILIIILLVICALLLILIVGLILRNSDFKWPCLNLLEHKQKTKPVVATEKPSIINV